ncbi:CAP domain-containing protein [Bacillus rubiinfantis]|uniref:CAP domain-containing protein n=1 Tax=Bacillus rubiinfantis TaxID=1499680 RepID=UPI0005A90A6F|nr:CAP domain-containing protein [Bacillus rubiinfantis]
MTVGFYISTNENPGDKVLIKNNQPKESSQSWSQTPDYKQRKKIATENPTQGIGVFIGKDIASVKKKLGTPSRVDETMYGYKWLIYNQDGHHYLQVGVENDRVVTMFALGENLDVSPFEIGQPVEEIFNTQYIDTHINIDYKGNSYRFELTDTDLNLRPMVQLGDVYVQLYIDKFTGVLSSVRFLDSETMIKQRPYELVYRGKLLELPPPTEEKWNLIQEASEKEIFDITNVLRLRYRVSPLLWDAQSAEIATKHSREMSKSNDISTDSKELGSLADRLEKEKITYQSSGENIAAKYPDGPAVVEDWLNSKNHREKLLNTDFTHIGIGVYQQFYTQIFLQKAE